MNSRVAAVLRRSGSTIILHWSCSLTLHVARNYGDVWLGRSACCWLVQDLMMPLCVLQQHAERVTGVPISQQTIWILGAHQELTECWFVPALAARAPVMSMSFCNEADTCQAVTLSPPTSDVVRRGCLSKARSRLRLRTHAHLLTLLKVLRRAILCMTS